MHASRDHVIKLMWMQAGSYILVVKEIMKHVNDPFYCWQAIVSIAFIAFLYCRMVCCIMYLSRWLLFGVLRVAQ